jgi:type IV pilus assembly protein PilE
MTVVAMRPLRKPAFVSACGFTLLELMIVVVIVGILAAIALPNYADYVKRGKIIEATSGLSDLRQGMEQYFLDNRKYTGYCATPGGTARVQPTVKAFALTCAEATSTYTLTATGVAAEGMNGFVYTIDNTGAKSSTITGVSGWTGNASCWAVRKSGECS